MSEGTSNEGLSERSESDYSSENSPRFGDDEEHASKIPTSFTQDLKTTKFSKQDFEIAQDEQENFDAKQKDKIAKTFYKPGNPGLISRSSSNKSAQEIQNSKQDDRVKEVNYEQYMRQLKNKRLMKKSDSSPAPMNDNEELKFILSHSNTLLTSEVIDEGRRGQRNIIDIDEDSGEAYEDIEEHLYAIDKKVRLAHHTIFS